MGNKVIYLTVTNDLTYDQRMMRICTTLANNGYNVTLVGRRLKSSSMLEKRSYQQKRFSCLINKGPLFYLEYNMRLFLYLLTRRSDILCAIDLDTILPVYFASLLKKSKRVYDAHELFCEMKEVVERPFIYRIWKWIEKLTVPKFSYGYTVNQPIAEEFKKMYGVNYEVIRNVPFKSRQTAGSQRSDYILYQGAVNEGRSFETLIPAMKMIDAKLVIAGDGNFMERLKQLIVGNDVAHKVELAGMVSPDRLKLLTLSAKAGITIFEKNSHSNYMSLANRFFDYIQAGLPQVCVDYPVYRSINDTYDVAVLTEDISPEALAEKINMLLTDTELWMRLHNNCKTAGAELNWENEEKLLVDFYNKIY